MELWQINFLFIFGIANIIISIKGFYESHKKKNAFGEVLILSPLGIFVWGDAVIFGAFWVAVSLVTIFLNNWNLFSLIFSLFWVVRSIGETIYWFNQQFSTITRVDPKKRFLYRYFHNDSVWFIFQILMQLVTVVSLIFSIYYANQWLKN